MAANIAELTEDQLQQLETIRVNHDEAYLYVSQGLSYQEQHQYSLARDMYEKGLEKIDKALNVRCDRAYCHGPRWDEARKFQQKMRKTSQMIKSQLRDIQNSVDAPTTSNGCSNGVATPQYTPPEPFEQPPSYDEACEHEILAVSRQSSCPEIYQNGSRRGSTEVVELFSIEDEVLLFYVSTDGSVSTQATQSSLHIYQFVDHTVTSASNVAPAWLQIGSWTYPLIPGQSPALESGYGAFLFPNVSAGTDSAVGVILPPTITAAQRSEFLTILNSLTAFRGEEKTISSISLPEDTSSKAESFSETLSRGIVTGAEYLSAGLVKGAALSSELIHQGASKAKQKISPEDQPVVVDPRVKEGLRIAREASGVALKATGFLVRKLGDLTLALGKQIAPHVKEQGSRLLSAALKKDQKEADDTMDGVLTVAAGGLQGFSTLYTGLEHAARTLAYSLSTETVNIVGHKYGNEVGEVVGNAVFSVGNLALTTHSVQSLGVTAIAKRTAKDTGKAVLIDYVEKEKKPEKQ